MTDYGIGRRPLPIRQHNGVFDRVIVTPSTRGDTIVNWWLDARRFREEGPYSFTLEWAEHPDAEFVEAAGPTAENKLIDTTRRLYGKLPHSVYRVKLSTPSTDFYSDPVYSTGNWNRHDMLIAKDIIRREYLLLTRYTGTAGYYLARKQWGELCPDCTDYNTGQVTDSHCKTCYGTGFIGGYHTPSTMYVAEDRVAVRAQRQDGVGMRADQNQQVRAVACPFLTAEDVWINPETDERWAIQQKQEVAVVRGRALVWTVELRLIERSDVVYEYPIGPQTTASSSST